VFHEPFGSDLSQSQAANTRHVYHGKLLAPTTGSDAAVQKTSDPSSSNGLDQSRWNGPHPLSSPHLAATRRHRPHLPLRRVKIPARSNHQSTTTPPPPSSSRITTAGASHPWQPPPFPHTAPDPKLKQRPHFLLSPPVLGVGDRRSSPWPPLHPTPSYASGLRLRAVVLFPSSVSARFTAAAGHQPPTPSAASTFSTSTRAACLLRPLPAPRPTRRPPRARSTRRDPKRRMREPAPAPPCCST
jgi:hypothetical protein